MEGLEMVMSFIGTHMWTLILIFLICKMKQPFCAAVGVLFEILCGFHILAWTMAVIVAGLISVTTFTTHTTTKKQTIIYDKNDPDFD